MLVLLCVLAIICMASAVPDCGAIDDCMTCMGVAFTPSSMNHYYCGWCADEDPDLHGCRAGVPFSYEGPSDGKPCTLWEQHDTTLGGNTCCSDSDNCGDCLKDGTQSWCGWCPGDDIAPADGGVCYHNRTAVAGTPSYYTCPDRVADTGTCCSTNADCPSCAGNAACQWCELDDTCFYMSPQTPTPDYNCDGNSYTSCCVADDCSSCMEGKTVYDYDCFWCSSSEKCQRKMQPDADGNVFGTCDEPEAFGSTYCTDSCFNDNHDCNSCVANPSCVWVSDYEWDETSAPDFVGAFCIDGDMQGPNQDYISWQGRWDFTVARNGYCWRSCSFTGDEMILALEISVTAVIVLSVASFCTIRVNNRRKYMKIVRGAEQLTDPDGAEESWDRHCEEPTNMERVRLTAQAVSWED